MREWNLVRIGKQFAVGCSLSALMFAGCSQFADQVNTNEMLLDPPALPSENAKTPFQADQESDCGAACDDTAQCDCHRKKPEFKLPEVDPEMLAGLEEDLVFSEASELKPLKKGWCHPIETFGPDGRARDTKSSTGLQSLVRN